jgi:hypothetical protein
MADEERQWSHQHPGGPRNGRREDCPDCTPQKGHRPGCPKHEVQQAIGATGDCVCGVALPDIQPHLNSEGEPCDCGQTPPQPGLVHYRGGGSRVLVDAAERLSAVAEKLDQQLNSRVHERELLRRAAAMIDEDLKPPTYEERLDWLAKYREVTS